MANMTVVFKEGDRGLICKSPEDGGPWIAPARSEKHAATLVAGHIVNVAIVGTSANGRLRFARVVEDISAAQDAALEEIKRAAKMATTFDDLKGRTWGPIGIETYVTPFTYDVETSLDTEGRPVAISARVVGYRREDCGRIETVGVFSPSVTFEPPLPLGEKEAQLMLAYQVVATAIRYTNSKLPDWSAGFVTDVRELTEAVRLLEKRTGRQWFAREVDRYSPGEDWPVMQWLLKEAKRVGAFDLRQLMVRVSLPLKAVQSELDAHGEEPVKKYTKEEVEQIAGFPGSERGSLGKWPAARLPETPQAGLLLRKDGAWYVAVAGARRELYKGGVGGLYARWVKVPPEVCADWEE